ncbi:Periplasmic copper-binding protein (NosD) [uncultured archaeon]|nr:Periplasmic copper-binding protein (NosD) [uncultured archaeon]
MRREGPQNSDWNSDAGVIACRRGGGGDNNCERKRGRGLYKVQDAIDNASAGDTILVRSGTYYESVNVSKPLTLRGVDTGGGKPVVDSNGSGDVITFSADGIMLDGFNATNGKSFNAGIMIASNNSTVIGSDISHNNYGIILYFSSNNTLYNNSITENRDGFILYTSSNNIVHSNIVLNNYYAMYLFYSSDNNTIYNNLFNNTYDLGYSGSNRNRWNTTKTEIASIVGGPYLGGNLWENLDGTGVSLTCTDSDKDWICDSNYTLSPENVDYLPLAVPPHAYVNGTVMHDGTGSQV